MNPKPTCVCVERPRRFARVLVPVDFTPASLGALRYAAMLGKRFSSTIYLLHVIETHPFAMTDGAVILMKSDEESARDAIEHLNRLARKELPSGLRVIPLVRRGRPAFEILRAANTLNSDLLILAAHRRSALGRLFLGSTLARIERLVICPMLVIRCDSDPGTETLLWREGPVEASRCQPQPTT